MEVERCSGCTEEINKKTVRFYSKTERNYEENIRVCLLCGYEEIVNSIPIQKKNNSQQFSKLSLGSN